MDIWCSQDVLVSPSGTSADLLSDLHVHVHVPTRKQGLHGTHLLVELHAKDICTYCTCTSTAAAETHARDVLMSSSSDEEQMPRMAVLQRECVGAGGRSRRDAQDA